MADKTVDLLSRARHLYQNGQKRQGALLIDEILLLDFCQQEAWEFLYEQYGLGQNFPDFQRAFTKKYYPDQLPKLAHFARKEPEEPKKRSFLGVLFGPVTSLVSWITRPFHSNGSQPAGTKNATSPVPPLASQVKANGTVKHEEPDTSPNPSQPNYSAHPGNQPESPTPVPYSPLSNHNGSGDTIRVVVVDDITETRESVIRSLSFESNIEVIGTANNGLNGLRLVREKQPDVVLMDVNMPDMDGITATSKIREANPTAQIIILTVQDDIDYMRKAMMAGARDFLTKPPMIDDLVSAVLRAGEIAVRERAKKAATVAPPVVIPTSDRGKIISVYSPKGGAGCTMLASNLAVALHNDETRVALIDGDLQYGDICVLFNEQGKNSVADLTPRAHELDPEVVEDVMLTHSTGIKILAAPRPERAEEVSGEQFGTLLRYLSKLYHYIIVDTGSTLNDVNIAAFDASDLLIVPITQDIPALGNLRKFMDLAPVLNISPRQLLLVMNQYDRRMNIDPQKVSQNFQHPIAAIIPADSRVVLPSINRGIPFMLQRDLHSRPVAKAMLELAGVVRQRLANLAEERIPA